MAILWIAMLLYSGNAQANKHGVIIGWIGLWNHDMVAWGENSNSKTRTWSIPAYARPSLGSDKAGLILIRVTPGDRFKASYRPAGAQNEIAFTPDLYEPDWGYGPYFHQTITAVRGDWVQLPKKPFARPVWINVKKELGVLNLIRLEKGGLYTLDGKQIVVIKLMKNTMLFRFEQPPDMWCYEGNPPAIKKVRPELVKVKSLYDANQHLKLKITYTRGC